MQKHFYEPDWGTIQSRLKNDTVRLSTDAAGKVSVNLSSVLKKRRRTVCITNRAVVIALIWVLALSYYAYMLHGVFTAIPRAPAPAVINYALPDSPGVPRGPAIDWDGGDDARK